MIKKTNDIIKKNFKWIICFVCLVICSLLIEAIFTKEIIQIDNIVYTFISNHLINDTITPLIKMITFLGSATGIIILTIILFLIIKNKQQNILLGANLCIITLINQILKYLIMRPRPNIFRIVEESGYSFPSGHSMVSMAFYGYLIYLVYQNMKNKYLKWFLIITLAILIILIGISRIYLGVHYTTDVLGGFLISLSYLIVYTHITKGIEK